MCLFSHLPLQQEIARADQACRLLQSHMVSPSGALWGWVWECREPMTTVAFVLHGAVTNTAEILARKLPLFHPLFSPGKLPCSRLHPSQALLLSKWLEVLFYTSVVDMGDVSYHIRYFLDDKNVLAMQESKIHTPIWHPPKGNNRNQICSSCYWVINHDMVDHWRWFINTNIKLVSGSSDVSTCFFLGPSQHPFLSHRQGDCCLQGNENS